MASIVQTCVLIIAFASLENVTGAAVPDQGKEVVAFSVGLGNTQYFTSGETVLYETVFVNEQDGYDPSTGVFKCPIPGIYMFQFHAYSTNHNSILWVDLVHNDQITVSVSGYNSHTVSSNGIIMQLRKGDRVQVKSRDNQSFSLFGIQDQIYSTFSGFLLSSSANQIYNDNVVG